MVTDSIVIRGARQHNLKNIDLEIPRNKMVVITGLSGSGKSSLAFDTIYAEGQRRYVESLSAYARQFLGQMNKPDVDYIEGLSPAVSIDQKSTSKNPRSTVGTVTEIYDYLRLLYARVGIPHCPQCGKPITQQTVEQMVDTIMSQPEGTKFQVLAPVVRGRKGEYRQVLEDIRKDGYVRVRVDGQNYEVTDDIEMDRYKQHWIDVIVDRLVVKEGIEKRLADSLEAALKMGKGVVGIDIVGECPTSNIELRTANGETENAERGTVNAEPGTTMIFSEQFACSECGISIEELAPRNFSFNSPYGACPECHGLGTHTELDPDLILPDWNLSLEDGAVVPLARSSSDYYRGLLQGVAEKYRFKTSTPIKDLNDKQRDAILNGADGTVTVTFKNRFGRMRRFDTAFDGIISMLNDRYKETSSQMIREDIERYMSTRKCPTCKGLRLKPESLAVSVDGMNISEMSALSVGRAYEAFDTIKLSERHMTIARQIIKEIKTRLGFLCSVGLNYLTLDRTSATLAGGEAQRIRLATQIGSGLMGVIYILDEPSIGLHQRDNRKLIDTLLRLRDLGNTVIVVEHDEDTIRTADHIIDMGPGAGEHGGDIIIAGELDEVVKCKESLTGRYLSGERLIPVPKKRRESNGNWLELKGAREHNLKKIDVKIPLGTFVCVTGVSGSGKSTLVQETLYPRLMYRLHGTHGVWGAHDEITGVENVDKIIDIDQSPIGRTPRSNPATYTGAFDLIRDLFASTQDARVRGYTPGRFSFNVKGGRCEACRGDGIIKIEMQFLPDVYVPCEVCKGKRYNRETLDIKYKGKTISDVLDMTVGQALEFFKNIPAITRRLQTIHDVGLDYIRLGQPATTLSGGEAQRVKLASELSKRGTGRTLYILDEPTTGLHFADIQKLLDVLNRLVDAGNTVLVIEHNLDVIKTADHIIDLGPEGGDAGGQVIACGTPEEVAANDASHTGEFLRHVLNGGAAKTE